MYRCPRLLCRTLATDWFYDKVVKDFNKTLDKDTRIKRFKLVADEWTPDSGELSPTLKLKRRIINEKYKGLIGEIYDHSEQEEFV